jgi:hypothetical protein
VEAAAAEASGKVNDGPFSFGADQEARDPNSMIPFEEHILQESLAT